MTHDSDDPRVFGEDDLSGFQCSAILCCNMESEGYANAESNRCVTACADNSLQGLRPALASSDPDGVIYRHNYNLAVTVPPCACSALDGLGHLCGNFIDNNNFQFDLGQKADDIFSAPVQLGVLVLAANSDNLADGQALRTDRRQRLFDLIQFERLDDCLNFFHKYLAIIARGGSAPESTSAGLGAWRVSLWCASPEPTRHR